MRNAGLVIMSFLAATLTGWAQPSAQDEIGDILRRWEKATGDLTSFHADVKRTTVDKALGAKDEFTGHAMFSRPNGKNGTQARLHLNKTGKAEVFERYLLLGPDLFVYGSANKVVRVQPIAKNHQEPMQHSLLSFILGISAKDAQARYKMTLDGRDKEYYLIVIEPRSTEDKAEFTYGRLAIRCRDHLLGQVWYRQANGTETTWDFSNLRINPQLPAAAFEPEMPKGWRLDDQRPKAR